MSQHHPMSAVDAAWLHMDRPTNLMVVNSALWFDEPVDWERMREVVAERIVNRFPRYRQRVVEGTLGRPPHWEDDPEFDLDLHIHHVALPAPGDQAALEELVGDRISTPLDRSKPLWEAHLIDGYGSGSAVLLRMHHCIADGITLARVLFEMTDEGPETAFTTAEEVVETRRPGGPLGPLARPVTGAVSAARRVGSTLLHEGMETAVHPGRLADGARELARDLEGLAKVLAISPEAMTPLKGELGAARRVAWSRPIPLDLVKAVGHAADATVNDTLVTAMAGALGAYVRVRAKPPGEIHAMVPFNLRPLDQPLPRELGNRFGLIELGLPIGIEDPRERLLEVKRRMDAVKRSREGAMSYGFLGAVGRAPSQVEALVIDLFSGASTLVLTNVPGPRSSVYLAGTPIAGVLPWAPSSGSIGMTVTIFSYRGGVTVGLMADKHVIPDAHEIVDLFEVQLHELAHAVGVEVPTDTASAGEIAGRVPTDTERKEREMSQENVDLVRSGYDDFNSGNVEGVIARLHAEVEWIEPGGGNSPSGTFKGPDSVASEVFAKLPENFDEFTCSVEEASDEGDTVVVTAHFKGKSKSGAELDTQAEHVWEVRDGKLARFENKVDEEAWAEAWS